MCAFEFGPVGTMPSLGVTPNVGSGMFDAGAATVFNMPGSGFSLATPSSPLMAGMNWSSGSSEYYGRYPGVTNMALASNNIQRGFPASYGLSGLGSIGGGLGLYGMRAPMMSFMPSTDFLGVGNILGNVWQGLVANMFGSAQQPQQQQPAGPAQPAAPQPPAPQPAASPTQVNASAGSGGAVRGGRRVPTTPLSPSEQARLDDLESKKNSSIPLWRGLNTAEQQEYDRLMSRVPSRPRARARP